MAWRDREPRMDPDVAPVEEILQQGCSLSSPPRHHGRLQVSQAVWLCPCETFDDAPGWLLYSVGADGYGWERMPDDQDVPDLVDAEHLTGCHPSPAEVLAWLRGEQPLPGADDFPEQAYVYSELHRRIGARREAD